MEPDRKTRINGREIAEYYWNGKWVVYIDSLTFNGSYEDAIKAVESGNHE